MPRKRTVAKIAQGHSVTATGKSRTARSTKKAEEKPKRKGTQRETATKIAARNAQIVVLREVHRMPWGEIARRFKITDKTARRGYDSHVEAQAHEQNLKRAEKDMREYIAVIQRNQAKLAEIIHDLEPEEPAKPAPEEDGAEKKLPPPKAEVRAKIAAIHEQADLIFREIALRQAIGDLPLHFDELVADRDFDMIMQKVLALLKERGLPREVFKEIADVIAGRMEVEVPKTHLAAVGEE